MSGPTKNVTHHGTNTLPAVNQRCVIQVPRCMPLTGPSVRMASLRMACCVSAIGCVLCTPRLCESSSRRHFAWPYLDRNRPRQTVFKPTLAETFVVDARTSFHSFSSLVLVFFQPLLRFLAAISNTLQIGTPVVTSALPQL